MYNCSRKREKMATGFNQVEIWLSMDGFSAWAIRIKTPCIVRVKEVMIMIRNRNITALNYMVFLRRILIEKSKSDVLDRYSNNASIAGMKPFAAIVAFSSACLMICARGRIKAASITMLILTRVPLLLLSIPMKYRQRRYENQTIVLEIRALLSNG